jgi:hypothetical protein
MLRHPSRHYINYLLTKRAYSTAQIIEHLDDLSLPLPRKEKELIKFTEELIRYRRKLLLPPEFDPLKKPMEKATSMFLERMGIHGMWTNDPFVGAATDLLFEPMIRRVLQALLLGPLTPAAIATRIAGRFGLPERSMNVRVVRAFAHYYWDPGALSIPEWRRIAVSWLGADGEDPKETAELNSDYLAALNAPRSAAGAALVLALTDRSADSLSSVAMYTAIRDQGFNMFMGHALLSTRPSLQRTQAAFMAFQMVRGADEELTRHRGSTSELIDEFRRIETTYDATKIDTVKDLPALRPGNVVDLPATDYAEVPADKEPDEEIA